LLRHPAIQPLSFTASIQGNKLIDSKIDHVGLNVKSLDESISFYSDFFGFKVIRRWDDPKQAFLELNDVVLGIIEAPDFDYLAYTTAHIAFPCREENFSSICNNIVEKGLEIISGPKQQRGGETILFRDPSGNIVEICYPSIKEWKSGES